MSDDEEVACYGPPRYLFSFVKKTLVPEPIQLPLQSLVGFLDHGFHELVAKVGQLRVASGALEDVDSGKLEIVYHRQVLCVCLARGSPA